VNVHPPISRIQALVEREVELRAEVRRLEHQNTAGDAAVAKEARRLDAEANGLRKVRLALLRRWQLL
jgi:hypothetical protein